MTVVGNKNTKELDNFKPFLHIRSAAKDPKLAFTFTMAGEKKMIRAIRRIYSSKSDHILVRFHFGGKKRISSPWTKYETPFATGRVSLKLLLMGYGKAAPIARRGACLGQEARHPLCEGARCATTTNHKTPQNQLEAERPRSAEPVREVSAHVPHEPIHRLDAGDTADKKGRGCRPE